ncbi:hypothetical protein P692DRAFT_20514300 [Suillus brevipes Sb2]|nr:hypothetical protein P692DRAFT_20514300 [Suillus brevipes Sb2]
MSHALTCGEVALEGRVGGTDASHSCALLTKSSNLISCLTHSAPWMPGGCPTRMSQEVPGSWTFTVINVGITFRCMQAQLANQGEFFASYVSKNFIPGRVSVGGRFQILGPSAHEALRVRSAIGRPVNRIFCMFMRLLVRRLHVPRILLPAPLILSENACSSTS